MKTKKFLNKSILMSCIAFTATLSCTNASKDYDSSVLIHVTDTPNRVDMDDYIKIESELVLIDTMPIISEMVDIAQISNYCYMLDNNKAISCIDLRDGKIIRQKRQIGHSLQELVQPLALAADSSLVYVYDAGSNKMVKMDSSLSFKGSIDMPYGFERFTKVDGGFLCYSEYRPAVHFITDAGKLIYTHYMANYIVDTSSKSNIFTRDENNNVYIKAEYSDTVFQWANGKCIPKYIFDFGKNSTPKKIKKTSDMWSKHFTFSMDYFVGRDNLIISYLEGREKRYVCYSTSTGKMAGFSVNGTNIPFIPQWKYKNCYYALVNYEITKYLFKNPELYRSMLIKYRITNLNASTQ